jgi:hypothetical protein
MKTINMQNESTPSAVLGSIDSVLGSVDLSSIQIIPVLFNKLTTVY